MLGASGAIAAVLGAYWVLYPDAKILTLIFVFFVKVQGVGLPRPLVPLSVHRRQHGPVRRKQ